ncbi:PREDICTED: kinesin-like protein KIN-10C isoform X3 [Ipomoea nil]|uniref:kinesin-like protein KIN-10C isoform X3 n=1 Tax=Ipomoea nil TaxID=35883 RepID=UPI000900E6A3|nr:PREDICTED: kinesin-like protein KIN-10C isoform X3 [Ipomoea nil]
MASSTPDLSRIKLNHAPNPSRKVRIVGKIRGFTDQELGLLSNSKPWITVNKSSDEDASGKVTILFGDKGTSRKDTFELDYCYDQGEDETVFSREIKPAISDVFTGRDASIIAYGARGSGKTYTIQGLATSAMGDILSRVEDNGKRVSISFFEVFQEHAYDLLDPDQREVQVFEDSQGKVKLKGLSQVSIKSLSEFHDICFVRGTLCKQVQKTSVGVPRRSHKGLIVYVSSRDENQIDKPVGVINFVDLAGYEDSRSSIRDGATLAESTRINRSLHSIMNVVFALNTNSHVPYRENKLTRMLKESLGGNNYTLMLACMNPIFCQDTIYTVSLASRSCENIKMAVRNSTTKCKSSTKRDIRPPTTPSSVKKQTNSGVHDFSLKKSTSVWNGRKLFSGGKVTTSKQTEVPSDDSLATKSYKLLQDTGSIVASSSLHEKTEVPPNDSVVTKSELLQDDTISTITYSMHEEEAEVPSEPFHTGGDIEKENKVYNTNKAGSPLLSERLRALTDNLKQLQASTPLAIKLPEEGSQAVLLLDAVEPKTPVAENDFRVSDKLDITKYNSPWEAFSERNSRVKDTFVGEYLKFMNSASKEDLKRLKGIGEKRAEYILQLRDNSPEHFKKLEDLQEIGLSTKQVKSMVKTMAGELFF